MQENAGAATNGARIPFLESLRGAMKGRFPSVVVPMLLLAAGACASPAARISLPPVTPETTGQYDVGRFVWHDLVTGDVAAAREFYAGVFGWTFQEVVGEDVTYALILDGGVPIGGIAPIDDDDITVASARWLSLLSVDDVDRVASEVEQAGGSIDMGPWTNPTRGRMAVVTDPQGATLGLIRALGGDPPAQDPAALVSGRWMWTELWARDAAAAVSLYGDLVGYEAESTDIAEVGEYRVLVSGGQPRAGVNELPWPEVLPNWLPYIKVDDPAAIARDVERLGGTVLIPPNADIRNGSLALVLDPGGAAFAIQRWPIDASGDDDLPGGIGGGR